MAHVTLAAPITGLSGKLSKSHSVVFNMRQAPTNNERMLDMPCYTNWREPSYKKREATEWNNQFAQIATATRERLEDPAYISVDQLAFKQQTKYRTLYSYVFNEVKKEIVNGK